MKIKKLKRIVSGFCATVIAVSCFSTFVAAEGDTTNAELAFSLKYLDSLPRKGEQGFDEFLKLPNIEKMDNNRKNPVKNKDGNKEEILVPEEEVFLQICNEVDRIENKVDGKTTLEGNATDVDEKTTPKGEDAINNNDNMSRQMKIAGEIYKWVAENIEYDDDTYESIKNCYEGKIACDDLSIKPQDALFVYRQKMGVCAGKAELTALMMRIAKIPSAYIHTTDGKDGISHAYNAIYLEENLANRTSWTLLDSTWGSTKSDKDIRKIDEDKINALIKGETCPYNGWIKFEFKRHDKYANEISEILDWNLDNSIDDKQIEELNNKLKNKLEELNKNPNNSFRFKEIRLFKDDYDSLKLAYQTDLNKSEAAKTYQEIREIQKLEYIKGLITFDGLILDEEGNLNEYFVNWYNNLSEQKGNHKPNISKQYIAKIVEMYKDSVNKFLNKKLVAKAINQINEEIAEINKNIETKLDNLNKKFKEILTFKTLKIYLNTFALEEGEKENVPVLYVNAETSLDFDKAQELAEKEREKNKERIEEAKLVNLKQYFPSFYDTELDFKSANENIIKESVHKIHKIYNYSNYYHSKCYAYPPYQHEFKVGEVKYELQGKDGDSHIVLNGNWNSPATEVKIPSDIAKFDITFYIGYGIKSLILEGEETVDLSMASHLKDLNVDKSSKYTAEGGKIYEIDKNASKIGLLNMNTHEEKG